MVLNEPMEPFLERPGHDDIVGVVLDSLMASDGSVGANKLHQPLKVVVKGVGVKLAVQRDRVAPEVVLQCRDDVRHGRNGLARPGPEGRLAVLDDGDAAGTVELLLDVGREGDLLSMLGIGLSQHRERATRDDRRIDPASIGSFQSFDVPLLDVLLVLGLGLCLGLLDRRSLIGLADVLAFGDGIGVGLHLAVLLTMGNLDGRTDHLDAPLLDLAAARLLVECLH